MADHFAATGDDLEIIAPASPGAQTHLRTSCGRRVRVHRVASAPLPGRPEVRIVPASASALRRRIDEFQPDIIHLDSPLLLGGRAAVAAQRAGVPVVAVHGGDAPGSPAPYGMAFLGDATWQLRREAHHRATVNLAPSNAVRDQMLDRGIERVKLWRRGADTSLFSPVLRSESLRASYARPEEKLVIYAGRLAPEKQVEDLKVVHDMPGLRLLIVGEGQQQESLRRLLPRARFAGFRTGTDLAAHLASADLFIDPGERETLGRTHQEAMASGLPVIAPRRGGPVDLVAPSRTGWLFTPRHARRAAGPRERPAVRRRETAGLRPGGRGFRAQAHLAGARRAAARLLPAGHRAARARRRTPVTSRPRHPAGAAPTRCHAGLSHSAT
ncbi:MAG: glycosyltransferase [Brachybacterium sp.]|nr:glycosyltransferase [Brachybacterium sp.]